MMPQFQLLDGVGKVIGEGEIEDGVYRLFSADFPNGYEEFKTLEAMFAASGGVAIQPLMFPSPARTRQLRLFDEQTETNRSRVEMETRQDTPMKEKSRMS